MLHGCVQKAASVEHSIAPTTTGMHAASAELAKQGHNQHHRFDSERTICALPVSIPRDTIAHFSNCSQTQPRTSIHPCKAATKETERHKYAQPDVWHTASPVTGCLALAAVHNTAYTAQHTAAAHGAASSAHTCGRCGAKGPNTDHHYAAEAPAHAILTTQPKTAQQASTWQECMCCRPHGCCCAAAPSVLTPPSKTHEHVQAHAELLVVK